MLYLFDFLCVEFIFINIIGINEGLLYESMTIIYSVLN